MADAKRRRAKRDERRDEVPAPGCWWSPRGKQLSKQDEIPIPISPEDLGALRRAADAALSNLDDARTAEERIQFAERLVRIGEVGIRGAGKIVVAREDLHALHQALHVAADRTNDAAIRGADGRGEFVRRLARIRKAALDAVCDHDDVERSPD